MSDQSPLNGIDEGAVATDVRRASVTLRADDGISDASLMDPAHSALADALKFTYTLLRFAMFALLLLFLFSGVQRVKTGEEGISLLFGNIVEQGLKPGPQFSWPQPIGELVKVSTGNVTLNLREDFFPELSDGVEKDFNERGADALAYGGTSQLNPADDGYFVTADGSIGHLRAEIVYTRTNATQTLKQLLPEDETALVSGAIRKGVVHASASMTIDEIYRRIPDDSRSQGSYRPMEEIVREVAQRTLDRLDAGIEIEAVSLSGRIPARNVIDDFNSVTRATEEAGRLRAEANTEREGELTAAAGLAAPLVLRQIDRYERELADGLTADAEQTLANIEAILLGKTVSIDGVTFEPTIGGQVAAVIQGAEQYQADLVGRVRGDAELFDAKRAAFDANPLLVVNNDWRTAFGKVMARENVQALFIPDDGSRVISLSRDPEIEATRERELGRQRAEDARDRRMEERRINRLRERLQQTEVAEN